jgi:hypothetical protein
MPTDKKYSWNTAIPVIIILPLVGWVVGVKVLKLMGWGFAFLEHGGGHSM